MRRIRSAMRNSNSKEGLMTMVAVADLMDVPEKELLVGQRMHISGGDLYFSGMDGDRVYFTFTGGCANIALNLPFLVTYPLKIILGDEEYYIMLSPKKSWGVHFRIKNAEGIK